MTEMTSWCAVYSNSIHSTCTANAGLLINGLLLYHKEIPCLVCPRSLQVRNRESAITQ